MGALFVYLSGIRKIEGKKELSGISQLWIKPLKKQPFFCPFRTEKSYLRHPVKQVCITSCNQSKFSTRT